MPPTLLYLLKLSISLTVIWIFYQLLLRRLTFYKVHRWYLLLYSIGCFVIPLINIDSVLENESGQTPLIIHFIPAVQQYTASPAAITMSSPSSANWDAWSLLWYIITFGSFLLLVRLLLSCLSLVRIRKTVVAGEYEGIKVCQVDKHILPFSFGNAIYINPRLHSEKEWKEIVQHEEVHIRQRHTIDIILAEFMTIFNWYNPFIWLIRHSIRQNLEFIADDEVLKKGLDRKNYQYHLLKVVGKVEYKLASNFNFSSLKKRIIMMNKLRSARLHLLKFLFILPFTAVLLVSFRDNYKHIFKASKKPAGTVFINETGIVGEYPAYTPLAGVTVVDKATGINAVTDDRGFYHMRIPVKSDTIKVRTEFHKDGYMDTWIEEDFHAVKDTKGMIGIGILTKNTADGPMMVPPYFGKEPGQEPTYEDALEVFKGTIHGTSDIQNFMSMRTNHPEVQLFYTTEDKEKQILVLKDGLVERYGYPGGMTVADMEKKYGVLPDMMKPGSAKVNKGYLSLWQNISGQAEKRFHTTNPSVREIIFPGDSRVLVVPVSGTPVVYDMDNDDPKERPAFEKLYGSLPDCVPAPGHHTHSER